MLPTGVESVAWSHTHCYWGKYAIKSTKLIGQYGARFLLGCTLLFNGTVIADDPPDEGNASNPLATVDNTDLRLQYFDLGAPERLDYFIDGAKMFGPTLKFKYELHYLDTDVSGSSESGFSSLNLKLIHFIDRKRGNTPYRLAIGLEWIKDLGDADKGIGSGADQLAPLVGVALKYGDTMVIPLVQHFESYNGEGVSQTATRLIALKPLPNQSWAKLDLKVPYDWENETVPASIELQLGRTFSPSFGMYIDGLAGLGSDRGYDWGVGLGLRFNY